LGVWIGRVQHCIGCVQNFCGCVQNFCGCVQHFCGCVQHWIGCVQHWSGCVQHWIRCVQLAHWFWGVGVAAEARRPLCEMSSTFSSGSIARHLPSTCVLDTRTRVLNTYTPVLDTPICVLDTRTRVLDTPTRVLDTHPSAPAVSPPPCPAPASVRHAKSVRHAYAGARHTRNRV